jgi:hypothetical protein
MAERDPSGHRVQKALVVLVNERLACDGELGRVSRDDVRGAVAYGAHPLVDTISVDAERVTIEARWVEAKHPRPSSESAGP